MNVIEVRERRLILWLGLLGVFFGGGAGYASILDGIETKDVEQIIICGPTFGGIFLLGVIMLMAYFLRRLVIDDSGFHYRTMFGRKRDFTRYDIAQVKSPLEGMIAVDTLFVLVGHDGRILARIEKNMRGSMEAYQYVLAISAGLPISAKEQEWRAKSNARKAAREEKKWNIVHYLFTNRYAWQTPAVVAVGKWWMRILSVCCIGGIVVSLFTTFRTAAFLHALLPLVILVSYLVFSRVVIFEYPKGISKDGKRQYIKYPFFSQMILMLSGLYRINIIDIRNWQVALLFGVVMFVVFAGVIWWVTRTPFGHNETCVMAIFILVFYCFVGTYLWNWVARVQEPVHISAEVLSERVSTNSKGPDNYYFTVAREDGITEEVSVSHAIYNELGPGDTVQVCERVSIFGVRYSITHLPE